MKGGGKMNNVSLIRYSPHESSHELTAQLVECYRDVFADGPWHEWLKCPRCQKFWGKKDSAILAGWKFSHCNGALLDFWPREKVICDLYHEITPKASCWLALNNDNVIGFCWGYPITVIDLELKLGISFGAELKRLCGHEIVAYQDEVGVLFSYRGRKIAKEMIKFRLNDFLKQDLPIGIVRTRQFPEPSETFLWYTQKLGYQIIATYPDDDGRVILGREFAGLKELLSR